MAGFDPPVEINSDIPDAQKWAFVNNNFRTIANNLTGLIVAKSGTTTLNGNASAGVPIIVTIPHGLGFIPVPLVYYSYATAYIPTPNGTGFGVSGGQVTFNNWSWSSTDATNLYINFFSGATTDWGIIPYRYYLLKQTAS